MSSPSISVLMCIYNGERYLKEAIFSILNQTFTDFELILINDCSTDRTGEILDSFSDSRIKIIKNNKNIGLTKSLNKGLLKALAKYVARQDADDLSHPDRLMKQLNFLINNKDIALIGSQSRVIDQNGKVIKSRGEYKALTHFGIYYQLMFGNPFTHSSVMFRKDVILDEFGGYNEEFRYNQDFELWSRVIFGYKVANLSEILIDYRNHDISITKPTLDNKKALEENFSRNIGIQKKNINRIMNGFDIQEWPELWSRINVSYIKGFPDKPSEALYLLNKIYKKYNSLYKENGAEKDISIVSAAAALRLTTVYTKIEPKYSYAAYLSAVHFNKLMAIHYAPEFFLRILHLINFGKFIRNLLRF